MFNYSDAKAFKDYPDAKACIDVSFASGMSWRGLEAMGYSPCVSTQGAGSSLPGHWRFFVKDGGTCTGGSNECYGVAPNGDYLCPPCRRGIYS